MTFKMNLKNRRINNDVVKRERHEIASLNQLLKEGRDAVTALLGSDDRKKDALGKVLRAAYELHVTCEKHPACRKEIYSKLKADGIKITQRDRNDLFYAVKSVFGNQKATNLSRYSRGLCHVFSKKVPLAELDTFLLTNGGIVGCEKKFSDANPSPEKERAMKRREKMFEERFADPILFKEGEISKVLPHGRYALLVDIDERGTLWHGYAVEKISAIGRYTPVRAEP